MSEIGLGDHLFGLHRVHEALDGVRQHFGDQPDLGDRGDVIVADAGIPQNLQQVGRGVRLDRVQRAAGKFLHEEPRGAARSVRTQQRDRLDRAKPGDVGARADAILRGS